MKRRPYILSIAGFDPSGGAGLLADIKTIEALKGYGLAVCTANTIQNDILMKSCDWIPLATIENQIEILMSRFKVDFVKIGIVENWEILNHLIDLLKHKNENVKIILDPVLRSSSGFDFSQNSNQAESLALIDQILKKIFLLTPNLEEIHQLFPDQQLEKIVTHISSMTNLLLKGGHKSSSLIGQDELFTLDKKYFKLNPKGQQISEKHGSGCVLSSGITTYLALGFPLLKACYKAKRYTEKVLSSNKTLLGYHRI